MAVPTVQPQSLKVVHSKKQKPKKYLIITSSGGGGHINAAEARKAELKALGIDDKQIDIIDLMGVSPKAINGPKTNTDENTKTYTPGDAWVPVYAILGLTPVFSGEENTKKWDQKQKEGTEQAVRDLEALVVAQPLAEAMQAKEVQKRLAEYLEANDVQAVYNTQALSTPAICQAVCDYNNIQKQDSKKLKILTTVTDLITHRADHFLSSLRKLTKSQASVLQMEIPDAPLLDPGETEKAFDTKYGIQDGLFIAKGELQKEGEKIVLVKDSEVKYPSSVKKDYLTEPTEEQKSTILIKASSANGERKYITDKLITSKVDKDDISIKKGLKDKLITITMGSQGSASVLEYIDQFAEQIKSNQPSPDGNIYLCIAAGKNEPNSLYLKVKDKVTEIERDLPENVKILPLAFQDGKHMASLLNNSDVLITRSGGMSSMEAKATKGRNPNRRVFVHSEAKLKDPKSFPKDSYDATYEALMAGTVKWEGGNAEYLLRKIGASLGSPETINFVEAMKGNKGTDLWENSLFHLAYDGKMNKNNREIIKKLILAGANPNLRFPGGSYLIDHCKDYTTIKILVSHGAKITAKSLDNLKRRHLTYGIDTEEYKKQEAQVAEAINSLKELERNFDPTDPTKLNLSEGAKSYLYADKFQDPKTWQEYGVVAIDKTGDFFKNTILRADKIDNYITGIKLSIQTDPTEKRSVLKRLRQFRNFSFDAGVFLVKQPINLVVKPIELVGNTVKAGLIGSGMLRAAATGEESKVCNSANLKKTGWKVLENLADSVTAAASGALVLSGFGAPIAIGIGGVSASISFGAANLGALTPVATTLNAGVSQLVGGLTGPVGNIVLNAEGIAEWGIIRPFLYKQLDPKKYFYDNEGELNSIGKKVEGLHRKAANPENSIEIRKQAQKERDELLKKQTIDKVAAPLLQTLMPLLKTEPDKEIITISQPEEVPENKLPEQESRVRSTSNSSIDSTEQKSSNDGDLSIIDNLPTIGTPIAGIIGTTVLGASLARGVAGTVGNAALAIGGVVVTASTLSFHLLNYLAVQAEKPFVEKATLKKQLNATASLVMKSAGFTAQKAVKSVTSVPDVLTGKADEKIKKIIGKNLPNTADILVDSYRVAVTGMDKEERRSAVDRLNEERKSSDKTRNFY